jgi:hypothetical protein
VVLVYRQHDPRMGGDGLELVHDGADRCDGDADDHGEALRWRASGAALLALVVEPGGALRAA